MSDPKTMPNPKRRMSIARRVTPKFRAIVAAATVAAAVALPLTVSAGHSPTAAPRPAAISAADIETVAYRIPFKVRPITGPHAAQVRKVIAFAKKQLGRPYRFGGASSRGWDCSGLTKKAYAAAGINIDRGHGAVNQWRKAVASRHLHPLSHAKPGDLIFWGGNRPWHVAISLGGNLMVAATKPGDVVKVQRIWGSPNKQVYRPTDGT